MASFGGQVAGAARFLLVAETGQFNRDVTQAEQVWSKSIAGMSQDSLKLEVAQEKLRRSIARYGPESRQAKIATIELQRAQQALGREAQQTDRRMSAANTGLRRFGSSARFALASLVGGAGLVYGLRAVVEAAKEQELVLGQTKVALEAVGLSYDQHRARIDAVIKAQSQLGFDDEKLLKTFQVFVRRTRDVEEALRLNALAADVARGRYIDLEQAQQIVLKATLGNAGALRRLGIDVEKGASAIELITALQEKYGKAAEGAANTATAASDRYNVAVENLKETLGSGLLPVLTPLIDRFAAYADRLSESEETQARVNAVVRDGEAVVRGFADGVNFVRAGLSPLIGLLGGAENAAKGLFAVLALAKLAAIARGIRGIGSAFGFMAGQAALAGTASATATAGAGRRGLPMVAGLNPVVLGVEAIVLSAFINGANRTQNKARWNALTAAQQWDIINSTEDPAASLKALKAIGYTVKTQPPASAGAGPAAMGGTGAEQSKAQQDAVRNPPKNTGTTGKGDGLTAEQKALLQLERAQLTTRLTDDLTAERVLLALYAKQEANTKATGDELFQIRQRTLQQRQRVQAIEDQIAADKQAARDAAAAKRKEAAQKEREWVAEQQRAAVQLQKDAKGSPYYFDTSRYADILEAGRKANEKAGVGKGMGTMEFLRLRASIFDEFAPNIFGRNQAGKLEPGSVTVVQNFNANTPPFQAARDAALAAQHVGATA